MSEWHLVSTGCTTRTCSLTYQSADKVLGMHVKSGGTHPDQRCYFVWGQPTSALTYQTEAEARTALPEEAVNE